MSALVIAWHGAEVALTLCIDRTAAPCAVSDLFPHLTSAAEAERIGRGMARTVAAAAAQSPAAARAASGPVVADVNRLLAALAADPTVAAVLADEFARVVVVPPPDVTRRLARSIKEALRDLCVPVEVIDGGVALQCAQPDGRRDAPVLIAHLGAAFRAQIMHAAASLEQKTPVDAPVVLDGLRCPADASDQFRAQLAQRLSRFATNVGRAAYGRGVTTAIVVSHGAPPASVQALCDGFARAAMRCVTYAPAVASAGAHVCLPPPAVLPYDCGVSLQAANGRSGARTLVLVHPTPIDHVGTTETIALPAYPGDVFDVAFYVRQLRVDGTRDRLETRLMRRHRFVPAVDAAGATALQVRMRVREDDRRTVGVAVDLEIDDQVAHECVRFDGLAVDEGEPLFGPALRGGDEARGFHWAGVWASLANADGEAASWSMARWRAVFEERASAPLSRAEYVGAIRDALRPFADVDAAYRRDLEREGVLAAGDPARVQALSRTALFQAMHALIGQLGRPQAVRNWVQAHPRHGAAAPDDRGREFANAVSQATAGRPAERLGRHAAELARFYVLASLPADQLNVRWT